MTNNYEEQLEKHIEALEKQYESVLFLLNDPLEKTEEGKIKLKDSQRKVYAEGVSKIVETADSLIERIRDKKNELEKLRKEKSDDKPKSDDSEELKEEKQEESNNSGSHLGQRLK